MSICMYARINSKCINEEVLKENVINFFGNEVIIQENRNYVIYENNKVIISFISEKKTPYNVYDSCICNGEFEYSQLIVFDIKKEDATIDEYKKIVDFCIYYKERVEGDVLITSDVHDEICLLRGEDIIWSHKTNLI